MSTPDLNWNLERKKQNPLHDHKGPFASPSFGEAEVSCSNIWLLQEIQVILFNDLDMYCSFHLSLAISVKQWTGLEMKLKNDRIIVSQAWGGRTSGVREVWGAATTHHGLCECGRIALAVLPWQAGLELLEVWH